MHSETSTLGVFKKILLISVSLLILTSCWEVTQNDNITDSKMNNTNFSEQFFAQIGVSDFKKEMENEEIILLDVRTPGELIEYGKFRDNQILIDINENNFTSEIAKLDKTKKYIIYCWHGNRSAVARDYMKWEGFSYVKDLAWWIDSWVDEGESVLK